jgi:hypothetical protein
MAHRKRRRHARENPLGDTTKIVLAVGVTAAVVGIGYYLWKKQQGAAMLPMGAMAGGGAAQGQGGVQSTPPVSAPQAGSGQTTGDASATSNASLNTPPWPGCVPSAISIPGSPPGWNCPPRPSLQKLTQIATQYAQQSYVPQASAATGDGWHPDYVPGA